MRYNKLIGSVLFGAIAVTGTFEGLRNEPYQDIGGVLTACYGETEGIRQNDNFTDMQCAQLLAVSLSYHNEPLEALNYQLSPNVHIATLDFTYNLGTNALKRSTLYKKLKNKQDACSEFNRWVYAAGRDCRLEENNCYGIVVRRDIETRLCTGELSVKEALKLLGHAETDKQVLSDL
ncbi:lysozyme [Vibrio albus]|uniref:Lysozyme n=1 Tax=Vibrio albus TaxID=2200953 RepID=A0A2U3BDG9_9VIBR|nr:lysozyme [Vibrio albus]PWI34848.1 lysozyme [Vibrio albus]